MSHGAQIDQRYAKTKKELKEAVKRLNEGDYEVDVYFNDTSVFDPHSYSAQHLPEGVTLYVVGPNPYTDRKWYAAVSRKGGKLRVE